MELVGRTGEALRHIEAGIADVTRAVGAIASGAQEQAKSLRQISDAVDEMDQVTQSNAAMVEPTSDASRSLLEQADALTTLICRYRLRSDAPAAPRRAA